MSAATYVSCYYSFVCECDAEMASLLFVGPATRATMCGCARSATRYTHIPQPISCEVIIAYLAPLANEHGAENNETCPMCEVYKVAGCLGPQDVLDRHALSHLEIPGCPGHALAHMLFMEES